MLAGSMPKAVTRSACYFVVRCLAAPDRGLHAAHAVEPRLAAFKVPDTIHIVAEIPKTPTGKVQRSRMATHLEEAAR